MHIADSRCCLGRAIARCQSYLFTGLAHGDLLQAAIDVLGQGRAAILHDAQIREEPLS